jgi:hypothetical protein
LKPQWTHDPHACSFEPRQIQIEAGDWHCE